ncbi:MAG: hypothetical protein IH798_00085, partial [Gemmatimonadetes bacterium]|nr:hypothetical protein [Gemmatimonadota bacterium]
MKNRRLVTTLLAAGTVAAQPATSQTRQWRPEERVVLRDYSTVFQVAATNDAVYAATTGGLIVYDTRFNRWLTPLTELDGFPGGEVVTAMLGDPLDQSMWIVAVDELVHYLPRIQLVERIPVPLLIESLFFDVSDPFGGLYLGTSDRQWFVIRRGSSIPVRVGRFPPPGQRLTSSTLGRVLRLFPAADAMQATALFESGRQYRYTSAAVDPMGRMAYFGTHGLGLFRYDAGVARLERMPFGLLADGVGAIAVADEGVWVGTTPYSLQPTPYAPGFTWLTEDLEEFHIDRGQDLAGYRFREVRDIARWKDEWWAATEAGVVRVGGRGRGQGRGRRSDTIDRRGGLPASDTYALAVTRDGMWVATSRGLALLRDDGTSVQVAQGAFDALAADEGTIWVGGPSGVLYVAGDAEGVTRPTGDPLLREPIEALAVADGRVVVATRDQIVW